MIELISSKRRSWMIVILFALESFVILSIHGAGISELGPSTSDDIIIINSDQDLETSGAVSSGSGSSMDPYIISGQVIEYPTGNGILIRNTTDHIVILNCTLTGGVGDLPPSLFLMNVSNIIIEGLSGGGGTDCIRILESFNITIKNSIINCSKVSVSAQDSSKIEISESWFHNGTEGLHFNNVVAANISSVQCGGFSDSGAFLVGCSDVLMDDVHSVANKKKGLVLKHTGPNITVHNSVFYYNDEEGIFLDDIGSSLNISSNKIYYNGKEGIKGEKLSQGMISIYDNDLDSNQPFNMFLSGGRDLKIIQNRIINGEMGGIIAEGFREGVEISSNLLSNNNIYNMELQGIRDTELIDNRIIGGGLGIYLGSGSLSNLISGNEISGNTGAGILMGTDSNGNTIRNNHLRDIVGSSIYMDQASSNNIIDNEIFNGTQFGIRVYYGRSNSISGNNINGSFWDNIAITQNNGKNIVENNVLFPGLSHGISFEGYCGGGYIRNNTIIGDMSDGMSFYNVERLDVLSNIFNVTGSQFFSYGSRDITFADNHFKKYDMDIRGSILDLNWSFGSKISRKNILGGHYSYGNYWEDYTGEDVDGDGIGDTELPFGPGDPGPLVFDPPPPDMDPPWIEEGDFHLPRTDGYFAPCYLIGDNRSYFGLHGQVTTEQFDIDGNNIISTDPYEIRNIDGEPRYFNFHIDDSSSSIRLHFELVDFAENEAEYFFEYDVSDIIPPSIEDISISDPSTGGFMEVEVDLSDNIGIDKCWLEVHFNNDPFWNFSYHPSRISDSGSSFEFSISIPEEASKVHFRVNAHDHDGNSCTGDLETLPVEDTISPTIEDRSSRVIETGVPFTVVIFPDDNVEVGSIELMAYHDDIHRRTTKSEGPFVEGWSYDLEIPENILELRYEITVYDRSGNSEFLSVSQNVLDATFPKILDLTTDVPRTGEAFEILSSISDNRGIDSGFIEWWFDDQVGENYSNPVERFEIGKIPPESRTLHYRIGCKDNNGNRMIFQEDRKIKDVTVPTMNIEYSKAVTGSIFEFIPSFYDNHELAETWIEVNIGYGKWTPQGDGPSFSIELNGTVENVELYLYASDMNGNNDSMHYSIPVTDVTPPEIVDHGISKRSGGKVWFYVEGYDNREIDEVYVVITLETGEVLNHSMESNNIGRFDLFLDIEDIEGEITVVFHLFDEEGNERTSKEIEFEAVRDEPFPCMALFMVVMILMIIVFAVVLIFVVRHKDKEIY